MKSVFIFVKDDCLVNFRPKYFTISKFFLLLFSEKTSFRCKINMEKYKKVFLSQNIPITMDETGTLLYPNFKNFEQYRKIFILFCQWNLDDKMYLNIGRDILKL